MCIKKHNAKADPMKLNFEGLENKPTDRAQRVDEKIGANCPRIMFTSGVTVIKTSNVAQSHHSQFGQNIICIAKKLLCSSRR